MMTFGRSFAKRLAFALAATAALSLPATSAFAFTQPDPHRAAPRQNLQWHSDRHFAGVSRPIIHARPGLAAPIYHGTALPRSRWFGGMNVYRPFGIVYPGFGFFYNDAAAWAFLGLSALSFAAYVDLNEAQQRAQEEAMIEATSAPIGEQITWDQGSGSGSVTAVREGHAQDGRECREFQQQVMVGGQPQQAYGTACRDPDGSWRVVNDAGG